MNIQQNIQHHTANAIAELYGTPMNQTDIQVQETKKEFNGDFTVVIFPITRFSKKSPQITADEIGKYLENKIPEIKGFEIVQGFLNVLLKDAFWYKYLRDDRGKRAAGKLGIIDEFEWEQTAVKQTIMVEYSSPNTNKPLHKLTEVYKKKII